MLYIALEGYECSGKSTLINKLQEYYAKDGRVLFVREPGTTVVAEQLRNILLDNDGKIDGLTEFMLFTTARIDLLNQVVNKALEEGRIVISDRSVFSSLVLQHLRTGLDIGLMDRVSTELLTVVPNRVFVLNVERDIIKERLENRKDNNSYDTLELYDKYVDLQERLRLGKLNNNLVVTKYKDDQEIVEDLKLLSKVDSYVSLDNNNLMDAYNNFNKIIDLITSYRDW